MFGVRRLGFALFLSKNNFYEVKPFKFKHKSFKFRNKIFIINKKEMFFLKGINPYINPIKRGYHLMFGNIKSYYLIYNLDKNKDNKFVQPLSFVNEVKDQTFDLINPYLLVSIANQKGYTSFLRSLIKQAQTFPKWLKFALIGIITSVVILFVFMFIPMG